MDESALRSALAKLDVCNSSLHWWLDFWTFLVAFGVVLEVVFVVWEYLEELHDFRRGVVHPPEKPSALFFFCVLLGTGLVAAGVSGEYWEESRISTLETCIREGNDSLFLLLSKEAGDAKESAKEAKAEAKELDDEAKAFKHDLANAQADLKLLQDSIRPRHLTQEQKDKIRKVLVDSGYHPPKRIPVYTFLGAEDGPGFARDILDAINSAPGWTAATGLSDCGADKYGLVINVGAPDPPHQPLWAKILQEAFKQARVEVSGHFEPRLGWDNAEVCISPKKTL
jgi:hypothetical protein